MLLSSIVAHYRWPLSDVRALPMRDAVFLARAATDYAKSAGAAFVAGIFGGDDAEQIGVPMIPNADYEANHKELEAWLKAR